MVKNISIRKYRSVELVIMPNLFLLLTGPFHLSPATENENQKKNTQEPKRQIKIPKALVTPF